MIVGFTGTQGGMTPLQATQMYWLLSGLQESGATHFHHGACVGADEQAAVIAHNLGYWTEAWPGPDRKRRASFVSSWTHPPMPFLDRNRQIVAACDLLIATPAAVNGAPVSPVVEVRRSGTWATVRYARAAGKPIYLMHPDGLLVTENEAVIPSSYQPLAQILPDA